MLRVDVKVTGGTKSIVMLRMTAHKGYANAVKHARLLAKQAEYDVDQECNCVEVDGRRLPLFGVNYVYIIDRIQRLMALHRKTERRRSRNLRSVLAGISREQSVERLWQVYYDKHPSYSDMVKPEFKNNSAKFIKSWCRSTGLPPSDWPCAQLWTRHQVEPSRKGTRAHLLLPLTFSLQVSKTGWRAQYPIQMLSIVPSTC